MGDNVREYNKHSTVLYFILSGFIGGFIYYWASTFLEHIIIPLVDPPKHTYGMESGVFSFPVSIVICAFTGMGVSFYKKRMYGPAQLTLLLTSVLGAFCIAMFWASFGIWECSSEIVVIYPPLALCIMCFLLLLILIRKIRLAEAIRMRKWLDE